LPSRDLTRVGGAEVAGDAGLTSPSGHYAGAMRDEVDRLVEAWRQERPDLDVEPLAVLSRVTRLARHLDRVRRQAFAAHGLDTAEFDVLAALRRSGAPYELTPGQLVGQTLVSSGTMTHRIDKLEARGLVRRRPDADDGRVVRVRLAARGRDRVDAALTDLLADERALLGGLSDRQRATLANLLRTVVAPFDERSVPRRS
jgi:DNA-binding MarR family transcriptional regulator